MQQLVLIMVTTDCCENLSGAILSWSLANLWQSTSCHWILNFLWHGLANQSVVSRLTPPSQGQFGIGRKCSKAKFWEMCFFMECDRLNINMSNTVVTWDVDSWLQFFMALTFQKSWHLPSFYLFAWNNGFAPFLSKDSELQAPIQVGGLGQHLTSQGGHWLISEIQLLLTLSETAHWVHPEYQSNRAFPLELLFLLYNEITVFTAKDKPELMESLG